MNIELVPLTELTPHPANARRGNTQAIAQSIRTFGQYRPLVTQRSTGHILAGNHTYYALRDELQATAADVLYLDIDDKTALQILLTDNRTSDLAVYDDAALAELLQTLTPDELATTAYDPTDLERLLATLNPPPPNDDPFPTINPDNPTDHRCPSCGYEWNGKPG